MSIHQLLNAIDPAISPLNDLKQRLIGIESLECSNRFCCVFVLVFAENSKSQVLVNGELEWSLRKEIKN